VESGNAEKHEEVPSSSFRKLFKRHKEEGSDEKQLLDSIQAPFWKSSVREDTKGIRERLMKMNDVDRLQTIKMVSGLYKWSPKVHEKIMDAMHGNWKEGRDKDEMILYSIRTIYESKNALVNAGVSKNYTLGILLENSYCDNLKDVAEGIAKAEKNNLNAKTVVEHIRKLKDDEALERISSEKYDIAVKDFNENGGLKLKMKKEAEEKRERKKEDDRRKRREKKLKEEEKRKNAEYHHGWTEPFREPSA